MCPFRRLHIDFKAHPAIIQDEIDDPAHPSKAGGISHGQNTGSSQAAQYLWYLPLFRRSHEYDLAAPCLGHTGWVNDLDSVAVYALVSDYLLEFVAEGILPEQANLQWGISSGKRVGGPFHKLGEIKEVCSLHLIFGSRLCLRSRSQAT
jgi:hypothetical protein